MVGHRYYNPEWGRWIQPDDIEYLDPTNINGLNLYAYCNNDPVNYSDGSGHFPILACLAGVLLSGAIVGLSSMFNKQEDESALGAFVGGFIDGAIGSIAVAAGLAIAFAIGAAGGAIGNATGQIISYGDVDYRAVALQALYSGMSAGLSTGVLKMTELFSTGGNFIDDFVDNLALWSSPDLSDYMNGAGLIGAVVTEWFSYYSLPSPNAVRKHRKKG
jgi:hypothetical protein